MKLSELIKTREVKAPGTDLVITIKEDLSWYEYLESLKISDETERGIYTLTRMIKDWNLTGENGEKLPITEESVKELPVPAAQAALDEANKIVLEKSEKKKN